MFVMIPSPNTHKENGALRARTQSFWHLCHNRPTKEPASKATILQEFRIKIGRLRWGGGDEIVACVAVRSRDV
jgi:hypothetical protein